MQYALKRLIDYLATLLALAVLSPLMLLIGIAIRLESRGPIYFRQLRGGLGGKTIRVWKYRTMVVDAEQMLHHLESRNESQGGVLFKIKDDPRITRVGRFLRRTSLDELPQLFNVLAGEMSLVGPRPLPLRDCTRLEALDAARFARRSAVIPGLTGLWQVSGRSKLGGDQMLELDCRYIAQWSLWGDLTLLVQTLRVILLNREEAY